jgi:hypothetical protein
VSYLDTTLEGTIEFASGWVKLRSHGLDVNDLYERYGIELEIPFTFAV